MWTTFVFSGSLTVMLPAPSHPGNPLWVSREEWLKMKETCVIEVKMTEDEARDNLLERFKLTDESREDAWGEVEADTDGGGWNTTTTTPSGWGNPAPAANDGGWNTSNSGW
ncbi:uncharacterized protein BYT42DRAFT_578671 [Radiomyces spectabilis]|uniref:uncharacterized protein n=1 Tax=Radiomyces spectabilis TaxID=64574 RepID=UPI0022200531|nr:uncharacterized protein BYT42DRAFT_578671 [Radiomyces spectabilis]KAI8372939.1 hypothetical protein BYT42DRAFT_578671 [Radiomyces spectabilis]